MHVPDGLQFARFMKTAVPCNTYEDRLTLKIHDLDIYFDYRAEFPVNCTTGSIELMQ